MKRLFSFFLTLLLFSAAVYANGIQQSCNDLAGKWTQSIYFGHGVNEDITYDLKQDATGNITGTAVLKNCAGVSGVDATFPIAPGSGANGNGEFTLVFPSQANCYGWQSLVVIYQDTVGCQTAYWGNEFPTSYPMQAEMCLKPASEQATTWFKWDGEGQAHYQAVLNPPTGMTSYNWSGRAVSLTRSNVVDDCYDWTLNPPNPGINPYIQQGFDYIDYTNEVDDDIGWTSPDNVNNIRGAHGRAQPCQQSYSENMYIDCQEGAQKYETHSNTLVVNGPYQTGNTITLYRNSTKDVPNNPGADGEQILGSSYTQQYPWFQYALDAMLRAMGK